MKDTKRRKLVLNRKTLRTLIPSDADLVRGGAINTTGPGGATHVCSISCDTCTPRTCFTSCYPQ